MTISYIVAVNLNDDFDYTDITEVISADVLRLHWTHGNKKPYQSIADVGELEITLRNISKTYSPETVSALAIMPGHYVRVMGNDGSNHILWTGVVESVDPQAGTESERNCVIRCTTIEKQLQNVKIRIEPQSNVTANEVIGDIIDMTPLRQPFIGTVAILDLVGHGELNSVTLGDTFARSFDVGETTFAYVGDTWEEGIPAYQAIKELCDGEHGRFFFDNVAQAAFVNRHYTITNTVSASFTEDVAKLNYNFGGDMIDRVTMTITPRSIGAANTILWQSDSSKRLGIGEQREIICRYRDAEKRPAGALVVIPPIPGVNYTANSAADGSGADVTSLVDVRLLKAEFSAATLDLVNNSGATAYITLLNIKGTPLYRDEPITLEQTNYTSISLYSPRLLEFAPPLVQDIEEADEFIRYELARRQIPRGTVTSIEVNSIDQPSAILDLFLLYRVAIDDAQTGHSGEYNIVGAEHWIDASAGTHRAKWWLEPADDTKFARLNYASLDEGYALAY